MDTAIAWLTLLFFSLMTTMARADQTVLRMASMAPEGTAWAREFRAFAREVQAETRDAVRIKWYFSGVAGDEPACAARIRRDQLDGAVGSANLCAQFSPSMRVLMLAGMFRDSDEATYVLNRMKPIFDAEFLKNGMINIAEAGMGFVVILSRNPVQSVADLRRGHFWLWDLDLVLARQLPGIVDVVPMSVELGARAYDEHKIDGFITVPAAALAFQWSTQARYISPLRVSFLPGCLLMTAQAFDQLPLETQQKIRSAAGKLQLRIEDSVKQQDQLLMGKLFARQGLHELPVSDQFRDEFTRAAHAAEPSTDQLLPSGARLQVAKLLSEYRRRHPAQ